MPKLANSVLYPVVKPAYRVIDTGRKHWDEYNQCYVPTTAVSVEWKQVGVAISVADAKSKGFIAPILDLERYSKDGGKSWEPNYLTL